MKTHIERKGRDSKEEAKHRDDAKLFPSDPKRFSLRKEQRAQQKRGDGKAIEQHTGRIEAVGIQNEGANGIRAIKDGRQHATDSTFQFSGHNGLCKKKEELFSPSLWKEILLTSASGDIIGLFPPPFPKWFAS